MLRPTLVEMLRTRIPRNGNLLRGWIYSHVYLPSRTAPHVAVTADRTALCWHNTNQRRSLGGLLSEPGLNHLRTSELRLTHPRGLSAVLTSANREQMARLRTLSSELVDATRPLIVNQTATAAGLTRLLVLARHELDAASQHLEKVSPRQVVLATQHGLQARAMILLSRNSGIPTIYVPHAPLANNRIYRDLPFDIAALRGRREVTTYQHFGVDAARLHDIGDPAFPSALWDVRCGDGPIVVAPSPWASDEVEQFIRVASEAIAEPFVVCPHPRSDLAELRRLIPRRATIAPGRTLETLAAGCRALVQHSSGVAVEAMLIGAPVVELSVHNEPPSYYAVCEPFVKRATDGPSLAAALDSYAREDRDALAVTSQQWGSEWVSRAGEAASSALRRLLSESHQLSTPLHEEWPTPLFTD
jgi:hypothetical protein